MTLGRLPRPLLRVPIRDRLAPFSRTGPAPVGRTFSPSAIPQTQRERFHDATDTGPNHGPAGTAGVSPAPSARRSYPSSYQDSTGHDDRYHYDSLYPVTGHEQGSLTLDQAAVGGVPAEAEAFAYDPTGNWRGYRKDEAGATVRDQERKNNRDNQIVPFDGSGAGVSYDKAGNALRMPPTRLGDWAQHYRLTWDAWNRLVRVQTDDEFAPPVAEYAYDGAFRRITVSNGILSIGTYYNDLWRPVEERIEGQSTPQRQYVWGARPGHRDELILRDRDTGGGSLDERLYCLMDYFDPTAVIEPSGAVVERYGWSAFGQRRVMDADWEPLASSAAAFDFGFHGQFLDSETGYYNYGYRYYSPQIGRWLSRDPIGEEGGKNLNSALANNPQNRFDRFGLILDPEFPFGWAIPRAALEVIVVNEEDLDVAISFIGYWSSILALYKTQTRSVDIREFGGSVCSKCCFVEGEFVYRVFINGPHIGLAPQPGKVGNYSWLNNPLCPKGTSIEASFHSHPFTFSTGGVKVHSPWASGQDWTPFSDPGYDERLRLLGEANGWELSQLPFSSVPESVSGFFQYPIGTERIRAQLLNLANSSNTRVPQFIDAPPFPEPANRACLQNE